MKYLSIFMILMSFAAEAQIPTDGQAPDGSKDVIMYDPLFWKSDLNLRTEQSKKIEEINTEFYANLREIKEENITRETKSDRLEQGLQERSQKIFQTLMPKQRRKLEKIMDKNAPVTAP